MLFRSGQAGLLQDLERGIDHIGIAAQVGDIPVGGRRELQQQIVRDQ